MSAVPVLDNVRYLSTQTGRPFIAISEPGTAVYVAHEIGEATLMWVDRNGNTTPIQTVSGVVAGVRLSPDGDTAVFHDEQGNLWSLDIRRGSVDLIVNKNTLHALDPLWHPDGDRVTGCRDSTDYLVHRHFRNGNSSLRSPRDR